MKVYILAVTSGGYMVPIGDGKLYKSLAFAKKALEKYNDEQPRTEARILVSDEWHDLEE